MENNSKLRKLIRESIIEEMDKEMRYVATMDFYVWANSDQDAAEQAKSIASELDRKFDNRASITSLVKQEHGTFGNIPSEFNEGVMKMLRRKLSGAPEEKQDNK